LKVKRLKTLLQMGKVSCFDLIIDVKREVEKKMDQIFYNLNA